MVNVKPELWIGFLEIREQLELSSLQVVINSIRAEELIKLTGIVNETIHIYIQKIKNRACVASMKTLVQKRLSSKLNELTTTSIFAGFPFPLSASAWNKVFQPY